ncbi:MAG: MBOAT family O-acyltransferase [Bacteroidota bacterium]
MFGHQLEVSTLNIILPVGISFYTFQTLSYTIDIYRKQLKPTNDALSFFSFVAFFPQLVAGPIERASHLLPQFFKTYRFSYEQVKSGLLLMAFGLFKKMIIADRAAIIVNQVYNNPLEHSGHEVILATVLFAFQIYCDFSGYSDIAIGAARTMGFDLMKNFDSPYFSKSITEFWRRWHISLSTWFRDYVYIPLGGNKKGQYRTYLNLFIVFVVSGLWHGAAMTFVIWGAIHGVFIVIEKAIVSIRTRMYGKRETNGLNSLLGVPFTFFIVCLAWIFFRANSLNDAVTIVQNSVKSSSANIFELALGKPELILLSVMILLLITVEGIDKKIRIYPLFNRLYLPVRWTCYLLVVFCILVFGVYGDDVVQEFIYFQF